MIGEGDGHDKPPEARASYWRIEEQPAPTRLKEPEALAAFRVAAQSVTTPPQPAPRSKGKIRGGDGKGGRAFTASNVAADYLKLCQNPLSDLSRWLVELDADKGRATGAGRRFLPTARKGWGYADDTSKTHLANAHGIRRQSLPQLRGRLDAHGQGQRSPDRVFARPRAGFGRYDALRQVRAERAVGVSQDIGARLIRPSVRSAAGGTDSVKGELSAIRAIYGAKMEATRRSLPRNQVAAAIHALVEEMAAAMRAVAERKQAAKAAARDRSEAGRAGERAMPPQTHARP